MNIASFPGLAAIGLIALGNMATGAAQAAAPSQAGEAQALAHPPTTLAPLFFKEEFRRPANATGQVTATSENLTNANLEIKLYGRDARNVMISGVAGTIAPVNLWTGLTTEPAAVLFRDKSSYVDLTGMAKVRWVTRASGFHVARPVVKLADGTFLVGDHADASTSTFLETEFAFAGMRWIKLDIERVVTKGAYGPVGEASAWFEHPDLSKVDEIGFVDLMPGSGHGSGGYLNVSKFEVYGVPVKR